MEFTNPEHYLRRIHPYETPHDFIHFLLSAGLGHTKHRCDREMSCERRNAIFRGMGNKGFRVACECVYHS